jgi:NAD(P)-dependent dehydrogenase (short-subunit alcohol dehydrogenase family)
VDLSKEHPGKLEIVKLDSADEESGKSAAATIESKVGKLDVVYANAGTSSSRPKSTHVPLVPL